MSYSRKTLISDNADQPAILLTNANHHNISSSTQENLIFVITFFSSPSAFYHVNLHDPIHVYTTRVAREGGVNSAWGDKFDLSKVIDKSFFYNKNSYIYLQLYTNRALLGPRFLEWCGIPARDIVDGFSQVGTARQLRYRLRKKDGSRGHGFVNVIVKLECSIFEGPKRVLEPDVRQLPEMSYGRMAIGIPVKMSSEVGDRGI